MQNMKERFYGDLNDKDFYAVDTVSLFAKCSNI